MSKPPGRLVAGLLDHGAAEAAAMAHDLGHPPFGHIAETELDSLASEWGGFEGNAQSFRIVCELALRSLDSRGLNLTFWTLNGILKYPWLREGPADPTIEPGGKWGVYACERDHFEWARDRADVPADVQSLEAEIMDWADDVTYAVHDVDDSYRAGLIPIERLARDDAELARFLGSLLEQDGVTPRAKFAASGLTYDALEEAATFFSDLVAFSLASAPTTPASSSG
jgi:dGTPase